MGRRRTPTAELERNGSFVKHPERKRERENEPKPREGPVDPPPRCFTVEGGASQYTSERMISIWHEILAEVPPGVLTVSDRKHLELVTRAFFTARQTNKLDDLKRASDMLDKIAMTPTGRAKLTIGGGGVTTPNPTPTTAPNAEPVDSPFSDIANETRPGRVN